MLALLTASVLACNLQTSSGSPTAGAPTVSEATVPLTQITTPAAATAAPTSAPTPTATTTQGAPPVVKVSASGGRLNVRRGPGPDYDTVGAFLDGQTINGHRPKRGRDVDSDQYPQYVQVAWLDHARDEIHDRDRRRGWPASNANGAGAARVHPQLHRPRDADQSDRLGSIAAGECSRRTSFSSSPESTVSSTWRPRRTIGDITVFEGKTIDIKEDSSGKKSSCP